LRRLFERQECLFDVISALTMPETEARDLCALMTSDGSAIGRTIAQSFAASDARVQVKKGG
jgi:hypothetical protein